MTSQASPEWLDDELLADVGRVIDRKYRLESLLGQGGMGSVWRAFHLQLEVPVAIKLLRAGDNAAELRERMRVEGRAVAKLVHPNIVRVFDIGEAESGESFIVMELLNGESLGTMLERGALSPVRALQLLLPIAEALALAHSRGVVHRDLKPDNILIAVEGAVVQPKLLDFGIAKVRSAIVSGGATVTQTGTLLGSPDYMSPEQAHGCADIDERSDVWAFCVVLYEALAGETPFLGDSCQAILRSVVNDEPLPLIAVADVEPDLSELVQRGLAKDREARPSSIFELGRTLAAWLLAHGVYEDAMGCSLEAKWFARSTEELSLHAPYDPSERRWEYEQATLVSVVRPGPAPSQSSDDLVFTAPARRGFRWAPSALVLAGAILGCVAWGIRHPNELSATRAAAFPGTASARLPEVRPATASREVTESTSPVVAVEAVPASSVDSVPPKTAPATSSRSVASAPSLPQALPRRETRETREELLNPY